MNGHTCGRVWTITYDVTYIVESLNIHIVFNMYIHICMCTVFNPNNRKRVIWRFCDLGSFCNYQLVQLLVWEGDGVGGGGMGGSVWPFLTKKYFFGKVFRLTRNHCKKMVLDESF